MNKITELIDTLVKYLNTSLHQYSQVSFPITEVIALAAAILSLGGLIFTTLYSIRQNTKAQNANARIEWIQKVRNVTAELISTYYSALNEDDSGEMTKIMISAREKIELLILYFGPKTKKFRLN